MRIPSTMRTIFSKSFVIQLIWMLVIGTTPVTAKSPRSIDNESNTEVLQKNATLSLTSPFKDDEVLLQVNYRLKRNTISVTTPQTYSSVIEQRLTENHDRGIALSNLISFLVRSSTGRNVHIFYDNRLYPDIAEGVESCSKMMAEVTLLTCRDAIIHIQKIIRTFNVVESRRNIILLCSSDQTEQIFQQILDNYLESTTTHWFVVLQSNSTQGIISLMREGTQVTFALKEYDFKYQLYVSFIGNSNKVTLRRIGRWSWNVDKGPSKSLKAPLVRPLKEVYSDFGGRQLTAAIYPNWPRWIMEQLEDGTHRPISGVDFHVLSDIGKKLNFTFWVDVKPTSFGMGGVRPDGTIPGLIGEVHNHRVHLVINEVTMTANRDIAVDYTYPYFLESVTLISPAPKKKLKEYAVFTSFTYEVWFLLALVTILIGPIVRLIIWFKKSHLKEINEQWDSLSDVSLILFKSIMLQDAPYPPKGLVFTLVFICWYVFCLLISSLYRNIMISTLVVPSYEEPIDSLWDFLDAIKHRDYKILLYCETQSEYMFTNTKKKIYKDIGNTFGYSKRCIKNQDEGMDKILTGKFVGVNNRMSAEVRANLRGRERYHIAKNEFYAHGYGIACPTGSPYREAFNKVLLPMMWSGLVQKYTNDELRNAARKASHHEEAGPEAFSLLHLQGGFFTFAIGNLAATAIFLLELIVDKYNKKSSSEIIWLD